MLFFLRITWKIFKSNKKKTKFVTKTRFHASWQKRIPLNCSLRLLVIKWQFVYKEYVK